MQLVEDPIWVFLAFHSSPPNRPRTWIGGPFMVTEWGLRRLPCEGKVADIGACTSCVHFSGGLWDAVPKKFTEGVIKQIVYLYLSFRQVLAPTGDLLVLCLHCPCPDGPLCWPNSRDTLLMGRCHFVWKHKSPQTLEPPQGAQDDSD